MPTINQLVRKGRKSVKKKTKAPALGFTNTARPVRRPTAFAGAMPAEAWRLHAGQDHDAQEAEFGACARSPASAFQSYGSHGVHPGRGAQLAGALGGAGPRRRVKDLPGVRYHIVRGTLDARGVDNRKKARSKYGTKAPKKSRRKSAHGARRPRRAAELRQQHEKRPTSQRR